mmetsp:Transcript_5860/g.11638  ORF Transcript_5860/g.11638 Transcript_5860/m.11638 type:complete len:136 (+) Transcript_5860:202-609(+)
MFMAKSSISECRVKRERANKKREEKSPSLLPEKEEREKRNALRKMEDEEENKEMIGLSPLRFVSLSILSVWYFRCSQIQSLILIFSCDRFEMGDHSFKSLFVWSKENNLDSLLACMSKPHVLGGPAEAERMQKKG